MELDNREVPESAELVAIVHLPARNGELTLAAMNEVWLGLWSIWPADRHDAFLDYDGAGGMKFSVYEMPENGAV